jgi:hypothetical protein
MSHVPCQWVNLPALIAAATLTLTAPFGCADRTSMTTEPDDVPDGSSGGVGGTGGPASSTGAAGARSALGGSSGASGFVNDSGGSHASSVGVDLVSYKVAAGGYVTSGPWAGNAFTVTDSSMDTTISPADFSDVGDGGPLCVKGVVSDHGLEVFAMIGINLAQPQDHGWVDVWTPTGSGLAYSLTVHVASPLRITIQGAAGYPDESWCVNLTGNSGEIPWTQFKQSCWASYGSFYDGQIPLESVMFEVPGVSGNRVNYDFCLDGVAPI